MKDYKNAPIICELKRSPTPLVSRVPEDEGIEFLKSQGVEFNGESHFHPFEIPDEILKLDVNIIQIVGPSGSGKSTFLKAFERAGWHYPEKTYDNSIAVISNFPPEKKEGLDKLNYIGLSSMPVLCRPRNVLSTGEGFRADMALNIESKVMVDEFTSVVNREVACTSSNSIQKYIRKNNLRNVLLCGCHYDIIPFLKPDILIDLDTEKVYDLRGYDLSMELEFTFELCPSDKKKEMWNIFAPHHYLSAELNMACELWLLYWGETLIGMRAVLPLPTGTANYCRKGTRVVVLPDYQGIGLGTRFNDAIAKMYVERGYKFYCRSAHIKMASYYAKTPTWRPTARNGKKGEVNGINQNAANVDRECASYEYVGMDFRTKPHLTLIVDELDGIDIEEARRWLVELKEKYYLTIVHGAVRVETKLNQICLELGIRTELLYIHGKLGGKHKGKRKLSILKPGETPKYGIVGDDRSSPIEMDIEAFLENAPREKKSKKPARVESTTKAKPAKVVQAPKNMVAVATEKPMEQVAKPTLPPYEIIVDALDEIDPRALGKLMIELMGKVDLTIVHGDKDTQDVVVRLCVGLGVARKNLRPSSNASPFPQYCGKRVLIGCHAGEKPTFGLIPKIDFGDL